MHPLTLKPETGGDGDGDQVSSPRTSDPTLEDALADGLMEPVVLPPSGPGTPDDDEVKAYRSARKDVATNDARHAAAMDPVMSSSAAASEAGTTAQQDDTQSRLDNKTHGGLFKKKRAAKAKTEAERLGLFDPSEAPALKAASESSTGEALPSDRELILQRVDTWVDRALFVEQRPLSADDVASVTADLTARFATGRLLQAWLDKAGAYWGHFQVERLPRDERKQLKQSDPAGFADYKADRKLTRKNRFQHTGLGKTLHDTGNLFRGKEHKKQRGPSPAAVAALAQLGSFADALERPILTQPAGSDVLTSGVALERGVDGLVDASDAQSAAAGALSALGLSAFPADTVPVSAADVAPDASAVVREESLQAATEADPELQPRQWVMASFPALLDADLGVHAKADATSDRLRDVRLGDRLPLLDGRRTINGSVWAEVLVEVVDGPDRIGWVDTQFTDLAQQPPAVGDSDVPAGLTVKDMLREEAPGQALPAYLGVYPEQTERPIDTLAAGADWRTLLRLVPQTADNDPDFLEVLVGGRPRFVARNRLRPATEEERLVHQDVLSAEQIAQVRRYAVTQSAPVAAAFFERLAQLPVQADPASASAANKAQGSNLTVLAGALRYLGFPQPYAEASSYADALELVRLEHGVERIAGTTELAAIAAAFGVGAHEVPMNGAMAAVRSGQAVVAWHEDALLRLVGQEGSALVVERADGRRSVAPAELADGAWLALELPAAIDAGTADRQEVRKAGTDALDAYKKQVYATSSADEQSWYLGQAKSVHAAEATSMANWLPSGAEAATMSDQAQDKAFSGWLRRQGTGSIGALGLTRMGFVAELEAHGGSRAATYIADLHSRATGLLDKLLTQAPSVGAYGNTQLAIQAAGEHKLLSADEVAAYLTRCEALRPAPTGPTDDDFAGLFASTPAPAGTHAVQEVASTSLGGSATLTNNGKTVGTENSAQLTGTVTGQWGNVSNEIKPSSWGGVRGWSTHGNALKIDGETLEQGTVDVDHLVAMGMDPTSARIAQVRSAMEPGSPINAYDGEYVSMAFNQLTFFDAKDGSNAMEMLGRVLFSEGVTPRPECKDLIDALGGLGFTVVQQGKGYSFSLVDPHLGSIGAADGWTRADLETLHKAGRFVMPKGQTPEQAMDAIEKLFDDTVTQQDGTKLHQYNKAELALRYDPEKLLALSAVFADPRVQAGAGMNYKAEYIDVAAGVKIVGNTLVSYPINELVLGAATKLANSAPDSAKKLIPRYFFRAAELDADILSVSGWKGKEALFNERILGLITGRGLSGVDGDTLGTDDASALATYDSQCASRSVAGRPLAQMPLDEAGRRVLGGMYQHSATTWDKDVLAAWKDAGLVSKGKARSWKGKETDYAQRVRFALSGIAQRNWEDQQLAAMNEGGEWSSTLDATEVVGSPMSAYGFDAKTKSAIAGLAKSRPTTFRFIVEQALHAGSAPRHASSWEGKGSKTLSSYNSKLRTALGKTLGEYKTSKGKTRHTHYGRQHGRAQDWLEEAEKLQAQGMVFADKVSWEEGSDFSKVGQMGSMVVAPVAAPVQTASEPAQPAHRYSMNELLALDADLKQGDTAALVEAVYSTDAGRRNLDKALAPILASLQRVPPSLSETMAGSELVPKIFGLATAAMATEQRELLQSIAHVAQTAIAVGQKYPQLLIDEPAPVPDANAPQTSGAAWDGHGSYVQWVVAHPVISGVGDFDPSAVKDPTRFVSEYPEWYTQGEKLPEAHKWKKEGGSKSNIDLYGRKDLDNKLGRTATGKIIGATFKDDADYYAAVDDFYAERDGNEATARTDAQKELCAMARKAAQDDGYFQQVVQSSDAGMKARLDLSGAMTQNEKHSFHPVLHERVERFHAFNVSVGIYKDAVQKIGPDCALRSQQVAHKWAVEHVFWKGGSTRTKAYEHIKQAAIGKDKHFNNGEIVDDHGNTWATMEHFVDKNGKAVAPDSPDFDDKASKEAVIKNIKSFMFRSEPWKSAAEGWAEGPNRWPNPPDGWPFRSPHIVGDAIDFNSHGFLNRDDAIIDYVANEFGLVRRASAEQWHFERTGRPTPKDPAAEH